MNKINVNKTLCTLYVQLNQYSYGKCIFTRFVYLQSSFDRSLIEKIVVVYISSIKRVKTIIKLKTWV